MWALVRSRRLISTYNRTHWGLSYRRWEGHGRWTGMERKCLSWARYTQGAAPSPRCDWTRDKVPKNHWPTKQVATTSHLGSTQLRGLV